MTLRDEIREQPEAAQRLLDEGAADVRRVAAEIRRRDPGFAVIAARGSSDHAALYAQYVFGVRNRLSVGLATPSTITLYGARPRLGGAVVLGISQSGRSPDIVAVLEEARRQGSLAVAITNDPSSPLALAADAVLDLHAGPERATAATKTYTTQLLTMAMLSLALDPGTPEEAAELAAVPRLMAEALDAEPDAERAADAHSGLDRCVVLGRGYEYATAREWALKLQELANILAMPFSAADFEHGPLALVEAEFQVLAVAPSGPILAAQVDLLRRLRERHAARLLVISDDPEARGLDAGLHLPRGVPGWLGPIVSIVPGQLYALHLTRARGLDPESPRTISKVTETR